MSWHQLSRLFDFYSSRQKCFSKSDKRVKGKNHVTCQRWEHRDWGRWSPLRTSAKRGTACTEICQSRCDQKASAQPAAAKRRHRSENWQSWHGVHGHALLIIFQTSKFYYSLCIPVSMVVTVFFFSYFKASAIWKGMENDKYNNGRYKCLILCEVGIPTTFQRAAKVWGLGDSLTEKQAVISYPFLLNHELSRSFSHFQLVTLEDYIIFWQAAKVLNARLWGILGRRSGLGCADSVSWLTPKAIWNLPFLCA